MEHLFILVDRDKQKNTTSFCRFYSNIKSIVRTDNSNVSTDYVLP